MNFIRKVMLSIALVVTPITAIAATATPASAHPDNGWCSDYGYYNHTSYYYDSGGEGPDGYAPAGWYQADFYDIYTSCEDGHGYYSGTDIYWTYLG